MPSYDDDLPTQQEEDLFRRLVDNIEYDQRLRNLIELKNLIIGSNRCKTAFYHIGILEILSNFLKEYSSPIQVDILIEIFDCLSSFAKSNNKNLFNHLNELNILEQICNFLTYDIDSIEFYESCLRCLRSFYLPRMSVHLSSILLTDQNQYERNLFNENFFSNSISLLVNNLFENRQILDIFHRLLSISKSTQISILEILSSICINNQRQNQIVEKDFIQSIVKIFIENISCQNLFKYEEINNEYLIGICLKFFCSISYENSLISQRLHTTISSELNQTLCEIISNLLKKFTRPIYISYYASKFFVNLCKTKVISTDNLYVCQDSLTTLIHLCLKIHSNQYIYLYIQCFHSLIYLLNGNDTLHHSAMYTEQFLNKLFELILTPRKLFNDNLHDDIVIEIRAAAMTLLAVLSSHHEDIKKRISDNENLIPIAIEFARSTNFELKLASLRLFHGLSRSVQQLHTTFNDTICDILFDAIKSTTNIILVKTASSVICNILLDFSISTTRLLSNGILDILFSFLTHTDHDLAINCIWALRNLSYKCSLKVKQDIINGLTIERIYTLLQTNTDEQILFCLLSLIRNCLTTKDVDIFLPMFNSERLLSTFETILEKKFSEKIHDELNLLTDYINSVKNSSQHRSSTDSINSTCRTSLYSCDDMDQLDCS